MVFDRFLASLALNAVVVVMELSPLNPKAAGLGLPSLPSLPSFVSVDEQQTIQPVGFIWTSLKDLVVVGTLFPILISFDLRKARGKQIHSGLRGYFFTAFAVFSVALVGSTTGRILHFTVDVPLCLSTSVPICVALLIHSVVRGEFLSLLTFNANSKALLAARSRVE